tara:strand:+ start:580 stop:771 length:192 start_codon:yes stop_codon:yes gene_type:complete
MQVGDLVRNKSTGDIALVTGIGGNETKMWVTLSPIRGSNLGGNIVYHAEYFEVISSHKGEDIV